MLKSRRLYILIIVIFVGGIFEAFKGVRLKNQHKSENVLIGKELQEINVSPFHMSPNNKINSPKKFKMRKTRNISKLVKKEYDFAKDHTFSHGVKKADHKDKNKKNKKKKDEKKKIVKKKEKETKVLDNSEVVVETEENNINNNEKDNNPTPLGFPGTPTEAKKEAVNGVPQTTEEWLEILLVLPTYKKVVEFIAHYQSQRINSQVFYEVLTAMAEDKREEINEWGVRAAGATPNYQSFHYLTSVIAEPSMPGKVRTLATTQLDIYKNTQYLDVLKSIVSSSEYSFTQTLAAQLIAKSAYESIKKKQNIKENQVNSQGEEPQRSPALSASVIKNYESTRDVLNQLLGKKTDSGLEAAVTEAINAINNFLS